MSRRDRIFKQAATLLEVSRVLQKEFNSFRGAVQFFQHQSRPELFIFQLQEAHIADVGRMLMQISFLLKMEYALLDGVTIRESRSVPPGGHKSDQQYKNALKQVYLNFRLDPWLQHYIFSQVQDGAPTFLDAFRLPYLLEDVGIHLPDNIPPKDAILKLLADSAA